MTRILTTFLALSLAAFSGVAQPVLNFYNWGQYVNPKTVAAFHKQFGIQVNQTFYDSAEMQVTRLLAGGDGIDVTVPASVDMPRLIHAGALMPIDKAKIPNLKQANPALYRVVEEIDPGNKYGVIYTYGTTGIAYNAKEVRKALGPDVPINSWKILFEPKYLKKLQSCGVSFLDDQVQVFGLTLLFLGKDPNSTNPEDYKAAAKYLMKLRPYLTYFNNNNYMEDLAGGNLCISMAYSGDTMQARRAAEQAHSGVQLNYVLPKEGSSIWFDMFVVPSGAPNPDAAWQFINFMLGAKQAAQNSNFMVQPNAMPDSKPYLAKALQSPMMTPDKETIKRLVLIKRPPIKLRALINKLWFQVKYGIKME